jgi:hypothetical protein
MKEANLRIGLFYFSACHGNAPQPQPSTQQADIVTCVLKG